MAEPHIIRMSRNDAWILAAVGHQATSSVVDLIWRADFLNRTVPGRDEIEAAITNLGRAGLVVSDDRGLSVTPGGTSWLNRFGSKRDAVGSWRNLARHWEGAELPVTQPMFRYSIGAKQFESAVAEYRHMADMWTATGGRTRPRS